MYYECSICVYDKATTKSRKLTPIRPMRHVQIGRGIFGIGNRVDRQNENKNRQALTFNTKARRARFRRGLNPANTGHGHASTGWSLTPCAATGRVFQPHIDLALR